MINHQQLDMNRERAALGWVPMNGKVVATRGRPEGGEQVGRGLPWGKLRTGRRKRLANGSANTVSAYDS